jgi:NADH:ubiquinone oxidoreductase subunit 5 (subunit L)/multisubunit Na+/H+ antiporter MnhA subunit
MLAHGPALDAGVLQAMAHATAKAAMFMSAGLVYAALGHDRIGELAGVARAMPLTLAAFAVAGLALMGIVPSGAYLAKKLLLESADGSGQWWWTWLLQGGAAFTAAYVVLVLFHSTRRPKGPAPALRPVSRLGELAALGLALASLLLACAALGPVPARLVANPLAPMELLTVALTLLGGTLLALTMASAGMRQRPADEARLHRDRATPGSGLERIDTVLRRWPVASLSLLMLAVAFAALLQVQ